MAWGPTYTNVAKLRTRPSAQAVAEAAATKREDAEDRRARLRLAERLTTATRPAAEEGTPLSRARKGMTWAACVILVVIAVLTVTVEPTRSRYELVRQGLTTSGHLPHGVVGPGCLCPEPYSDRRAIRDADPEEERSQGTAFFRDHAIGDTLVVMMCNGAQVEFVDNVVCSMRQNGMGDFVIFATGIEAYKTFKGRGYPVYFDPAVVGEDQPEGSVGAAGGAMEGKLWRRLLRARLDVALFVLNMDLNILFLDTDVVVERNVVPEMLATAEGVDGAFMWDGPTSGRRYPAWANAGFYLVKATPGGVRLFEEVKALSATGRLFDDDQEVLNQVLAREPPVATYALLDRERYICGHTLKGHVNWPGHKWKTSKGPAKVAEDGNVAAVHVNWTGDDDEKRRLLMHGGFWHVCPNFRTRRRVPESKRYPYPHGAFTPQHVEEEVARQRAAKAALRSRSGNRRIRKDTVFQ